MAIAPPRTRHLSIAVLADVHLGTSASKAKEVLDYLDSITPDTLVLAGDFIELDKVRQGKLKQVHLAVIRRVLDLAHSGTKVYYLTGNHDARLRKFGNLALGDLHIRQELILQFDGHRHYFFHGDLLDAAVKYKLSTDRVSGFWRTIRSAQLTLVDAVERTKVQFKQLVGRQKWSLATEVKTDPARAKAYVEIFERAATRLAENKGCDHVICAHIHQPKIELRKLDGKVIHYLNAGDWIDNLTALEYRFGKWELYRYDADDFPTPSSRLRTPLERAGKGVGRMEEELMRKLVSS
ncbi:MAG: UDP-2,3-diacylglucosamine diphosphatase [Saprospiraceae bacterium]